MVAGSFLAGTLVGALGLADKWADKWAGKRAAADSWAAETECSRFAWQGYTEPVNGKHSY